MAIFESNRKLEMPQIRIKGTRIVFTTGTGTGQPRRTTQSYSEWVTTSKTRKEKNAKYRNPDLVIRNDSVLTFQGTVKIKMRTPNTSLKDYARQQRLFQSENNSKNNDLIEIGEINPTSGKGEIRYTLNGKDPSRTKYKIYKNDFKIKNGTIGAEKVILKARLYTRGRWSDVTSVEFKIVQNLSHMNNGLVIDNSQA